MKCKQHMVKNIRVFFALSPWLLLCSQVKIIRLTLTLNIELDLCLSAFDVQPVVRSGLAAVRPHHVPGDVP